MKSAKRSGRNAKEAVQKKPSTPDIVHISNYINSCWAKLQKYYALTDESPVYAAAIVLNPEYKFDYFKVNQEEHQDWIEHTEESIKDLQHTMYKDYATSTEAKTAAKRALDSSLFLPTPRKEPSNFDQWVSRHKYKRPAMKQKQDEYR